MCCRGSFVALSFIVALAVSSQVSAQQQQGYPPAGYQQPYPQQQPQPMPQQQPLPQQEQGYYPPQQPAAPGYGYPGYAPQQPGFPGQAYGAPPAPMVSSVNGAIQIGAGISLLGFDSTSLSPSAPKTTAIPVTGMMDVAPAPSLITTCCVLKNPLLVEGGYGLSDQLILGAQLQFVSGSEATSDESQTLKQFAFSIGPKIEYQFAPTSRWNPFLGAVVNVTLESKSFYTTKDSRTIFGVMVRGGMRYFILDQLSIDPTLALGGHFGSGTQTLSGVAPTKIDYSLSGFQFALSLGLSLWVK